MKSRIKVAFRVLTVLRVIDGMLIQVYQPYCDPEFSTVFFFTHVPKNIFFRPPAWDLFSSPGVPETKLHFFGLEVKEKSSKMMSKQSFLFLIIFFLISEFRFSLSPRPVRSKFFPFMNIWPYNNVNVCIYID